MRPFFLLVEFPVCSSKKGVKIAVFTFYLEHRYYYPSPPPPRWTLVGGSLGSEKIWGFWQNESKVTCHLVSEKVRQSMLFWTMDTGFRFRLRLWSFIRERGHSPREPSFPPPDSYSSSEESRNLGSVTVL